MAMTRNQSKIRRLLLLVLCIAGTLLFGMSPAWAYAPPIPPRGTRVYFVPSMSSVWSVRGTNVYRLSYEWLTARGYAVTRVETSMNIEGLLRSTRGVAFIVVVGGTEAHLTARVYTSSRENPRLLEASGSNADQELASMILRHITDSRIADVIPVPSGVGQVESDPVRTAAIRHLQRKEYAEALALFRRAQRDTGEDTDTLFNIAICLDGLNKPSEAEEILKRVYSQDPFHEEAGISL